VPLLLVRFGVFRGQSSPLLQPLHDPESRIDQDQNQEHDPDAASVESSSLLFCRSARMNNCTCLCLLVAAISSVASAGAAELKITQDIIPPGKCGRPLHRPMRPTFITIHSTDNTSRSANALNHALAMNKGLRGRHNRTGFLTWHFTVDDHSIYQTLPTNETGEHADYEGQGNRSSIGIEMCVNRGNDLGSTVDRTAQLTARLMREYDIPLDHVVPHMHWRMIRYSDHRDLGFKQCPRLLLDGGRLGPKWSAFIAKVSFYAR